MTDLETTKAMLDRAGVKYAVRFDEDEIATVLTWSSWIDNEINRGLSGCFASLNFDMTGALMNVGAWED